MKSLTDTQILRMVADADRLLIAARNETIKPRGAEILVGYVKKLAEHIFRIDATGKMIKDALK